MDLVQGVKINISPVRIPTMMSHHTFLYDESSTPFLPAPFKFSLIKSLVQSNQSHWQLETIRQHHL